jgi:hypothetical protein
VKDYRELEHLEGLDDSEGRRISTGSALYRGVVLERMLDVGDGHAIPGHRKVEGHVILEAGERLALWAEGGPLTLRLADGRTFPFRLTDGKGTLAGRGDLK